MVVKKSAFTLVEVLISLLIIGVVTTLLLPSFQQGFNEFAMDIKRRVLFTRVSQAIRSADDKLADFTSAYDYIDRSYRNSVSLRRVCGDKFHISTCEFPKEIFRPDGTSIQMPTKWSELNPKIVRMDYRDGNDNYHYSQPDSDAAALITDNGESILVFFNRRCKSFPEEKERMNFYAGQYACINMVYDVNRDQPPNMIGKDIGFITVFNPTNSIIVAPFLETPEIKDPEEEVVTNDIRYNYTNGMTVCSNKKGQLRVPTDLELASVFINGPLTNIFDDSPVGFWSITTPSQTTGLALIGQTGFIQQNEKSENFNVLCLK